ncbi:Fur family transcriptional regulator [Tundrisphaera sp. TA3]|uniref:Fur family transcriptional regulator n=1 Tax=Tundrisphaera sp. TA3 TaxID=3435775 RepID=UPI003EB8E812
MNAPKKPDAPDMTELRSALESSGRRLTRQRAAVFAHLQAADHHPTAEDVYRRVQESIPSISLATVYKALEALVESGLATRLAGSQGSARYDGRGEHHYHLRCLRSGLVRDLPTSYDPDLIARLDPELAPSLRREGFRVTGYRLELLGYFEEAPAGDGGDVDPS